MEARAKSPVVVATMAAVVTPLDDELSLATPLVLAISPGEGVPTPRPLLELDGAPPATGERVGSKSCAGVALELVDGDDEEEGAAEAMGEGVKSKSRPVAALEVFSRDEEDGSPAAAG